MGKFVVFFSPFLSLLTGNGDLLDSHCWTKEVIKRCYFGLFWDMNISIFFFSLGDIWKSIKNGNGILKSVMLWDSAVFECVELMRGNGWKQAVIYRKVSVVDGKKKCLSWGFFKSCIRFPLYVILSSIYEVYCKHCHFAYTLFTLGCDNKTLICQLSSTTSFIIYSSIFDWKVSWLLNNSVLLGILKILLDALQCRAPTNTWHCVAEIHLDSPSSGCLVL